MNRAGFSGGWLAWILRGYRHDLKLGVVGGFRLAGGMLPMGSSRRRLLDRMP